MSGSFARQRRWIGFSAFFAASLLLPWSLRTLFSQPSGPLAERREFPPEQPVWGDPSGDAESVRARNFENNLAWVRGGTTEVPYDGIIGPPGDGAEDGSADASGAADPAVAEVLSPGIYAAYMRSWDSLDIVRRRDELGIYIYPSPRTRLEAYVSRHRFTDDADAIEGHGGGLRAAQIVGDRVFLEEGIGVNGYDGIRRSVEGYARAGYSPRENLFLSLDARVEDVWERLPNIRDGLRLWSVSPYLYFSFLTNYWVSGYWSLGYFSDHNFRQVLEGELGRFLSRKIGLSVSGGVQTYQFREPRGTYWTPSYYQYLFGRVRLSKNFESDIWERRARENFPRRIGYLAEYTAGTTENRDFDQTLRGGLSFRLFDRWILRAEAYHLNANARFTSDNYYENRIDGRIDFEF